METVTFRLPHYDALSIQFSSFEWKRGEESLSMSFHYQSYINCSFYESSWVKINTTPTSISPENINIFFSTNALPAAAASPGPQTWSWLRSQSAPAATTAPTTATAARPGEQQQQQQQWIFLDTKFTTIYYNINWSPNNFVSYPLTFPLVHWGKDN